MLKGSIQLQSAPIIPNTINMVPVDHVARVIVACAFHPPVSPLGVAQITGHPRMTFSEFGGSLAIYGYHVAMVEYETWRRSLESFVERQTEQKFSTEEHALMPLYHFATGKYLTPYAHKRRTSLDRTHMMRSCRSSKQLTPVIGDLPANTKAPELSDTNAIAALRADSIREGKDPSAGSRVTLELLGVYLAYLVAIGFLPPPHHDAGRQLPVITLNECQMNSAGKVGGRGANKSRNNLAQLISRGNYWRDTESTM